MLPGYEYIEEVCHRSSNDSISGAQANWHHRLVILVGVLATVDSSTHYYSHRCDNGANRGIVQTHQTVMSCRLVGGTQYFESVHCASPMRRYVMKQVDRTELGMILLTILYIVHLFTLHEVW